MKMKNIAALVLTAMAVLSCARLDSRAQAVAGEVLRLHVVAASDSDEDQALKLKARDAVLALLAPSLSECDGRDAAEALVRARLGEIEKAAEAASGQKARATLCFENFPTRRYETSSRDGESEDFTLPAGEYLSLRVTLGEGAGHNWWCVVYPPLCAAVSREDGDAFSLLSPSSASFVLADGTQLRFRLLELLSALKQPPY